MITALVILYVEVQWDINLYRLWSARGNVVWLCHFSITDQFV